MTTLSRDRARDILDRFSEQRILVIGDLMLDRYIYGSVRRISPEAPVPVVNVTSEKDVPGGASNVAWNIQAVGGQAVVSGVVGQDQAAADLMDVLKSGGVCVDGVRSLPHIRTTVKTRIIAERQQVVRVDWEDALNWSDTDRASFVQLLETQAAKSTGMIIEDYGKGVVSQLIVRAALQAAAQSGIPVGYDPKDDHELDVRGVTVATPNRKEAYQSAGVPEPLEEREPLEDPTLLEVGKRLREKWGVEFLMMTLGAQGMLLLSGGEAPMHVPTRAREVFDVSGAGDTVIAVCTCALAAGATHLEAAELANYAAGVVVAKLGTATCSPEEILDSIE